MDETTVIRQLQRSDTAEAALEEIIFTYSSYVCTIISRTLGDRGDCFLTEELASDVFFALWKHRMKLKSTHLRGFLAASAKNKAVSFLRSPSLPTAEADETIPSGEGDDLFLLFCEKECRIILTDALQQIPAIYRSILILYYFEEKNTAEIAAMTGLSADTVKSRLRRGREKLKIILEKTGYWV